MVRTRLLTVVVAAFVLVATGVLVAGAAPAGAGNPGPVQIPLVAGSPPGVTCPGGTYVAANPGPQQSPVFVLKDAGPLQCPPGSDVLVSPGPQQAPTGQAVGLPLTAKSCAPGTALLNQELSMLGTGTPGGPAATHKNSRRTAGCPSGDAALAALHTALANVPGDPGGTGFITPGSFGLPAVQRGFVTVDPGPINAPALSGSFELKDWSFDVTNNGQAGSQVSGPGHVTFNFKVSPSGLTKVHLVQFSPVVTLQPVSQSAPQGSSVTFTASAIGNPAPTVQWQFSTNGGASWNDSVGETSTSVTAGALFSFENGWELRAVFTNSLGTAISDPATVTVTP